MSLLGVFEAKAQVKRKNCVPLQISPFDDWNENLRECFVRRNVKTAVG